MLKASKAQHKLEIKNISSQILSEFPQKASTNRDAKRWKPQLQADSKKRTSQNFGRPKHKPKGYLFKDSCSFRDLLKIYEIESPKDVIGFLRKRPKLLNVLLNLESEIRKYFPLEKLRLTVSSDVEVTHWKVLLLSIIIAPDLVEDAFMKLNKFTDEWWAGASLGIATDLCINVDFE